MRVARTPALLMVAWLVACSSPAKPVVAPPTDDAGRARLLLLADTDLPAGWRGSAHRADPVAEQENRRAASCAGAPDPTAVQTADVFGKDFDQGAQSIGSEAVFVQTTADAARVVSALKGARAVACAAASVRPILAEQLRVQGISATVRSVRVARRTFAVQGFVAAFHVIVILNASGGTITVEEDAVFLSKGRAQARATFVDIGVAFPSVLEDALVKTLSAKLVAS